MGRQYGVSKHTIYAWKAKYGGMDVSKAQESEAVAGRECTAEAFRGGPLPGQRYVAIGAAKKLLELVVRRAEAHAERTRGKLPWPLPC